MPTKILSVKDTAVLKSFFLITVLIHHLYQNTYFLKSGVSEGIFDSLGYLSVSVFLFLSGYGLTASYKTKGKAYTNSLPRHKILPLYIRNLILIGIYLLFWLILDEKLSIQRIVLSFFFGHTVIKYGWYIQAALFFYLLFFLSFKVQNKFVRFIILFSGYALYFLLCDLCHCWSMWYISVFAFAVGVISAMHPKKINIPLFSLLFMLAFTLGNFGILSAVKADNFKILSATVFPLIAAAIKLKLPFCFTFLQKLSLYSFEIYVSQGLFITLYHSKICYIDNDMLYIVAVIVSTIIFAALLKKLFSAIKIREPKKIIHYAKSCNNT